MGSWNETCGLSNLPIMRNDKVVLFMLESNCKGSILDCEGITSPNSLFEPILPLFAKYNDSRKYIDIEIKNKDAVLYFLKNKLKSKEYICKKDDFDINSFDLEEFIYLIQNGYVFNNALFGDEAQMSYMVIHRDIYDKFMNLVDVNDSDFSLIKTSYDYTINEIKMYENQVRKSYDELEGNELEEKVKRMIRLKSIDFPYVKSVRGLILDIYIGDIDKYIEDEILKLAYINKVLYKLRKCWMPQAGLGSQEEYNEFYVALAECIFDKCKKYEDELD